jgi:membrane associated rhomboid family serine protease
MNIWSGLILGLLLVMFQYINLRNRVYRAALWPAVNLIAWGLALAVFPLLLRLMDPLLVWAVCGLIGGAITGWAMSRLVHQPQWKVDEAPLRDDYQS